MSSPAGSALQPFCVRTRFSFHNCACRGSLLAADPSGSKAVRIAGITCTGTTPGIAARVGFSFLPGPPGSSSAFAGNAGKRWYVWPRPYRCGRSTCGSFLSGEALLPATKAAQLPSTTKVARPHSNFPTRREVPAAGREGRAA